MGAHPHHRCSWWGHFAVAEVGVVGGGEWRRCEGTLGKFGRKDNDAKNEGLTISAASGGGGGRGVSSPLLVMVGGSSADVAEAIVEGGEWRRCQGTLEEVGGEGGSKKSGVPVVPLLQMVPSKLGGGFWLCCLYFGMSKVVITSNFTSATQGEGVTSRELPPSTRGARIHV